MEEFRRIETRKKTTKQNQREKKDEIKNRSRNFKIKIDRHL